MNVYDILGRVQVGFVAAEKERNRKIESGLGNTFYSTV